jgi:triacylglycerol lipase
VATARDTKIKKDAFMNRLLPSLMLSLGLVTAVQASAASFTTCNASTCSSQSVFAWPWEQSSYAQTKYPIVLAHGMGGFSHIGPVDYFYGIPQDLAKNGASVFVTQVTSFGSSVTRGEQLLGQIQTIEAITGAKKVNIIGHSQGTLDGRYVAAVAPTLVASVTGVGGPNTGSPVADLIQGASTVVGPTVTTLVASVVNGFFSILDSLSGQAYHQDALAGLKFLTTAGSASFNAAYPAAMPSAANACGQGAASVNGVKYYSWGGTGVLTNPLDISDAALGLTSLAFQLKPNDGLVGQCSSHLGVVIRDNYFMNHLDEVNLVFGLVSVFETNPVAVFRQQANRLKLAGL